MGKRLLLAVIATIAASAYAGEIRLDEGADFFRIHRPSGSLSWGYGSK